MVPEHDMMVVRLPHEDKTFAYFYRLDKTVGVSAIAKAEPWGDDANVRPFVSGVFVHTTARRKGIATQLMTYIERVAALQGIGSLALYVHEDNAPARNLYAKLGYRPMLDNGDEIMLVKFLDPMSAEDLN